MKRKIKIIAFMFNVFLCLSVMLLVKVLWDVSYLLTVLFVIVCLGIWFFNRVFVSEMEGETVKDVGEKCMVNAIFFIVTVLFGGTLLIASDKLASTINVVGQKTEAAKFKAQGYKTPLKFPEN